MSQRYCFVTIGATAPFNALICSALQPAFLRALADQKYTNLLIQFGKDGEELFRSLASEAGRSGTYGLTVQGFDLTKTMREVMRFTKAENGRDEGVVLCHAGTGSVLDAIRIGVPVIVVPNPTLLDNHQVEFAEQMAKMGFVVYGDIDNLPKALVESRSLSARLHAMPSAKDMKTSGFAAIIDEEMGIEHSSLQVE